MKKKKPPVNISEVLANRSEYSANLIARTDLAVQIVEIIKQSGWTQTESARRCGVAQPRINYLLRGHIHHFSLDALVNIAAALGHKVRVEIKAA
jgi:predicted XRE-type DNA-binding protein